MGQQQEDIVTDHFLMFYVRFMCNCESFLEGPMQQEPYCVIDEKFCILQS